MKTRKVEQLCHEFRVCNAAQLQGSDLAEILETAGLVEILERDRTGRAVRYAETAKFWNAVNRFDLVNEALVAYATRSRK